MADVPYGYSYETAKTARRWTKTPRKVKGITIHHWGATGSAFNGIVDWFCAPTTTAQTSAHYVAQGTDANGTVRKRVACIVDPDCIAWHAGDWAANVDTIGIECRPEARDADYEVVAELVARLWLVYGVLPLYPHKHWANTACPGKWDLARLKSMATVKLSELKAGTTPTPAPAPTAPVPTPTTPTKENPPMTLTSSDVSKVWLSDGLIPAPGRPKTGNTHWAPGSYLYELMAETIRLRADVAAVKATLDKLLAAQNPPA